MKKRIIKQLAAHWLKDERTIRRWLKTKNHPMITHPESQEIIESSKKQLA